MMKTIRIEAALPELFQSLVEVFVVVVVSATPSSSATWSPASSSTGVVVVIVIVEVGVVLTSNCLATGGQAT